MRWLVSVVLATAVSSCSLAVGDRSSGPVPPGQARDCSPIRTALVADFAVGAPVTAAGGYVTAVGVIALTKSSRGAGPNLAPFVIGAGLVLAALGIFELTSGAIGVRNVRRCQRAPAEGTAARSDWDALPKRPDCDRLIARWDSMESNRVQERIEMLRDWPAACRQMLEQREAREER